MPLLCYPRFEKLCRCRTIRCLSPHYLRPVPCRLVLPLLMSGLLCRGTSLLYAPCFAHAVSCGTELCRCFTMRNYAGAIPSQLHLVLPLLRAMMPHVTNVTLPQLCKTLFCLGDVSRGDALPSCICVVICLCLAAPYDAMPVLCLTVSCLSFATPGRAMRHHASAELRSTHRCPAPHCLAFVVRHLAALSSAFAVRNIAVRRCALTLPCHALLCFACAALFCALPHPRNTLRTVLCLCCAG